jgi:CheY-like chemotaxis protein
VGLVQKEYFKRIKSLFLPYQLDTDEIHQNINTYIDKIDGETERLERGYENDNMYDFCAVLNNIQGMLDKVSAKRHEAYTVTLIRSSKSGKNEYSKKVLQQAIADFLLLSIEMQKAQSMSDSAYKSNEMEEAEEAVRNLSAVVQLIEAEDYKRAKTLVGNMAERGMNLVRLTVALEGGSYDLAKEAAIDLQKTYSNIINNVSTSSVVRTVLAVDDRPEILTTVNAALQNHYKTLCAPTGSVAMNIINQQDIGLFILDIEMPEMDGFELARRIRGLEKHKNTPIIFLTANSSRERIQRAISLNISDFIVKPAYNETLLSKVKKYLK